MRDIQLNEQQQKAVDHIYGPLLVLAGPGTGKTQLLSARIATILQKTDANPQNILCLTFTDNAAKNMRERLTGIIGEEAYDVHINTYHGFGSDIIRQYPDFFESINLETGEDSRLERPVDELTKLQITEKIINKLPYDSPLIGARNYVKNVSSTISDLKRGLVLPDTLRSIAAENLKQVRELSPRIAEHLSHIKRFPSKAADAIALFEGIADILQGNDGLAAEAHKDLTEKIAEATSINKSSPLTAWKNTWLTKDANDQFCFTDENQHRRMAELATVYDQYQQALDQQHLYDFDDMILRVIDTLKSSRELKFNLQEKYQFILLDEFQDTNTSQFALVQQLADNPVHENRPNIFAVGDDDQAIYAFQGAEVSNMLGFREAYDDVTIINLTENYRSHPDIIHTAHQVAHQIESRLHLQVKGIVKTLVASAKNLPKDAIIERHEFSGEANEYAWVSHRIKQLIDSGIDPKEIAVLAPKHKILENIVPFMSKLTVPISYEKREDILQTQLVQSLLLMSELAIACNEHDSYKMNELFPRVLSLDFFQIPVQEIWHINWQFNSRDTTSKSWAELALDQEALQKPVLFFLQLGVRVDIDPLEYMLDYITGNSPVVIDNDLSYTSPLKEYYFHDHSSDTLRYYELLTNLSTIREHIRNRQASQENLMHLTDFLSFIAAHETAEQPLINTHPIAQSNNAVQLMTTHKAKGLEFEHVFLLSMHDDIWGKKARSNGNKVSLPANLQHIRYQGSNEDELRRLLFVAITRAKHGLYLTSHAQRDNGKATEPVKYLLEFSDGDTRKSTILPLTHQQVIETAFTAEETMQAVDILWNSRHLNLTADLKNLLQPRLDNYMMSPTHLNTFIDTEHGGPEQFLLQTLLRFPQAPGTDGEYGTAIHATLDKIQKNTSAATNIPTALRIFDEQLKHRYIPRDRLDDYRNRGHNALKSYLNASETMWQKTAKSEVDFRREGVTIGEALLTGKIDRLEIDKDNKIVHIVDFKTGKPFEKWSSAIQSQKYKQQLYFYKLLIEGSHTWSGYSVGSARLEFVEPDSNGKVASPLYVQFENEQEAEIKQFIIEIWAKIQSLDLSSTILLAKN